MSYPVCLNEGMINRRNFLQRFTLLLGAGWAKTMFGADVARAEPVLRDPPENADWDWWRDLPRTPIARSDDPLTNSLCRAAVGRRQVSILYDGGLEPNSPRRIAPLGVFEVDGYRGVYVLAFCTKRQAERTFRLDRIVSAA
jgi:predicted DNA-binding transcriptional regulator YafY